MQQAVEDRKKFLFYHPEVETGSKGDGESDMEQIVIERVSTTAEVHAPTASGSNKHPTPARSEQREDPQAKEASIPQPEELHLTCINFEDASTQTQPPEDSKYCVSWCKLSGQQVDKLMTRCGVCMGYHPSCTDSTEYSKGAWCWSDYREMPAAVF